MLHASLRHLVVLLFGPLLLMIACAEATAFDPGPPSGALVIVGGGRTPPEAVRKFIELAGGIDAPFVVVPTANPGEDWGAEYLAHDFLTRAGATHVTVLHTRDRAVADSEAFTAPLRECRGVWFDGGRQWRLADAYLHTRTQREFSAVLARGGVIGGSSAGATIQGSFLVRGAPEGNQIMMAPGHEEGFGFLPDSAIDQHVLARHRENDLAEVIAAHPQLLGIGIDEGAAIIVQSGRFTALGRVVIHVANRPPDASGKRWFLLEPGDVFDLQTRDKLTKQ